MPLTAPVTPDRDLDALQAGAAVPQRAPALLVARLGAALAADRVRACQWKGHAKRSRWVTGEGDLDLLVDRAHAAKFSRIMDRLGFKLALGADGRQMPGVLSFYGADPVLHRLIHIHVHYQLVVGPLWSRHYHLPIERAVLDTATQRLWFKTPSPELELILLVVHSTLRHELRDLARKNDPHWLPGTRQGLTSLGAQADRSAIGTILTEHLPDIDRACFERCLAVLQPGATTRQRLAARADLARRLGAFVRRPPLGVLVRQLAARFAQFAGLRPGSLGDSRKYLASGGTAIALVGADGSGKSTCAQALRNWLAPELRTIHVHLGLPPKSFRTRVVGLALKVARVVDRHGEDGLRAHLELLRIVCTARDRYGLYRRVRRFTARGGIAICERYPTPESYVHAGPSSAQGVATELNTRLAARMRCVEARYYMRLGSPDLTVVLRVDPETAVRRKTTEPAEYVRERARMIAKTVWPEGTRIVDASLPFDAVLATARTWVWEAL